MSGLSSLKSIFQKRGEQYVAQLMSSYVVVNEKLEGSYFGAQLGSDNVFKFFKKGSEISYTDRVLNRFYNKAIQHFESLPEEVLLEIPNFYLFAMQYFPQSGNLVLSHIHELSVDGEFGRTIQTKPILDAWAKTLGIAGPPILFEGYLTDEQKSALLQLISTPHEDHIHSSFEKALLSIFGLHGITDKLSNTLVFRFYENESRNEERSVVAKLVSPAIETLLKNKTEDDVTKVKADDFVWLILVDVMNFIESFSVPELKEIELSASNVGIRYVELINALYKKYIESEGQKWDGLEINVPEYLRDPKFNLNTDLIHDSKVKELIAQNTANTEIYRIMLNMLRNPNVKINSKIFTENMKKHLQVQIQKLNEIVQDKQIHESYFPTFAEFLGNHASYFAVDEESTEVKKNLDVNVIVDYFQPVNNSHIKVAKKLQEKNGLKTILVAVSQVNDTRKYPLPLSTIQTLLEKVYDENSDLIEATLIIPNWSIEAIVESLRTQSYVPTLIACTSKRIMDYAQHLEYYKRKRSSLFESIKNIKLVEVDHNDFGDRIRQTLVEKNKEEFEKLTPESVHSLYGNLTKHYPGEAEGPEMNAPVKIDQDLKEHFDFLKMVISDDSNVTVETKTSLADGLNTVKKKIDSKPILDALKVEILERKINEKDADAFLESIISDSEITSENLVNFRALIQNGIQVQPDKIMLVKLDNLFERNQIGMNILDKILSHKLNEHDGSGIGEFATAILFKGAEKAIDGDVMIGESKIEIKNNNSQLFSIRSINEQSAFKDSSDVLERKMIDLYEMILASEADNLEEVWEMVSARLSEKREFNFNQRGIRNYMKLFRDISALIPTIQPQQLHEWFASIFIGGILNEKNSLPVGAEDYLIGQVGEVFESGKDAKNLLDSLSFLAFKYYAKIDNFTGMILYRSNHELTKRMCLYIPESIGFEEFVQHIEPITGPSLVDSRTSRAFKVRMRSVE